MIPRGFVSWRAFFGFALAREYRYKEDLRLFSLEPSLLERVGSALSGIVMKLLDLIAKKIRNPLFLTALTLMSLFFVSVAFYPAHTWAIATRVVPWIASITASQIQALFYAISQATILGLGLQAYGRLSRTELMAAYQSGVIEPVPIGASVRKF